MQKKNLQFKPSDIVWVAHASEWVWTPTLTKIDYVLNDKYYCKVRVHDLNSFNSFYESCVPFDMVFKDKNSCAEYIDNYYYGGYCRGCKYDKISGTIWNCEDCSHLTRVKDGYHNKYICKKCNIIVGGTYTHCHAICKYYDPTLPQNIREYVSWEHYDDILRHCEFNPDCECHKKSCHKTSPYDRYMNQVIRIYHEFMFEDKECDSFLIKRKNWINLSFYTDNGIICQGVGLKPQRDKRGNIKKGTANKTITFDNDKLIKIPLTKFE